MVPTATGHQRLLLPTELEADGAEEQELPTAGGVRLHQPKQGKDEKQGEGGDGEGWKERDKGGAVTRASRGVCLLKCDVGLDVPSLPNLHVIGWEEAVRTPAHTSPPPLINHLNVGDDVIGVKGDLVVSG